jgi:hypothetical protein
VNAVAAASPSASAPPVNPEAGRPDLAEANPVDPTGAAISLNQTPDQAANSLNCTLIVPNHPLSARGLATPWQLSDGCSEANPNEEAFVESTILAPNGKLKIYDPLVITQGTTPAAAPTVPVIPRGAQVIINVGFNGNNLVLEGGGAFQGRCIDAFGNSIIAQTSACNAAAFYADANFQIATGRLRVPRLGTGTDGQACESTESFSLIDQDARREGQRGANRRARRRPGGRRQDRRLPQRDGGTLSRDHGARRAVRRRGLALGGGRLRDR